MRLRREARWLFVIAAIAVLALVCGFWLLSNERLASPFADSYTLHAEFSEVDAVTPSVGEAVDVAGVRVGQIVGVRLEDGRGVLTLRLDPQKLPRLHARTRALLVPNTPLKDMQVDLVPGPRSGPALASGATIPLGRTTAPVDSDELLQALDTDTRTWLQGLISDVGVGVRGRRRDLHQLLRSAGPTTAQVHRIAALLASRRHQLPRLVHNLSLLSQAAGSETKGLVDIVDGGDATLGALASQDRALERSLSLLPGTLSAAQRTLTHAAPFSRTLRRTLGHLEPSVKRLPATLRNAPDSLSGLLPLPPAAVERFTAAVQPLRGPVAGTSRDLGKAHQPLLDAFSVINETTNELAHVPANGSKSYLFWFGWFAHNADSMVSTEDANGAVWRGLAVFSCASFNQSGSLGGLLQSLFGTAEACK